MKCDRSDAPTGWPWQFFELAGAILLALRPDGRVTYINQKGAETLGHPVREILDRDWFEHFVPARVRECVRKADPAPDARPRPASSMAAPGSAPPSRWRR